MQFGNAVDDGLVLLADTRDVHRERVLLVGVGCDSLVCSLSEPLPLADEILESTVLLQSALEICIEHVRISLPHHILHLRGDGSDGTCISHHIAKHGVRDSLQVITLDGIPSCHFPAVREDDGEVSVLVLLNVFQSCSLYGCAGGEADRGGRILTNLKLTARTLRYCICSGFIISSW